MSETRTFRAPGRVNLIGEHTDYNLGFVLPIALDLSTYIETTPADDGQLHVFSEERHEERAWPVAEIAAAKPGKHWSDYTLGVARELAMRGVEIPALRLRIRSDVPNGSGLSSSAALEVSSALAILQGRDFNKLEIAKLCQRAEIDFVGVPCGIMDQYVSVFGVAHAALCLDCRSLEHRTVRIPDGVEIVAVNSMVKHQLGSSAYRTRVEECAIAVEAIARKYPQVKSLRDAEPAYLDTVSMPRLVMRRARHVISENKRVQLFVGAAERSDAERMGELFVESHRSMQHDYEISCDEIDFLVDTAVGIPGCHGARMTGGGFGGCTVNLLEPSSVSRFQDEMTKRYHERFGITPAIFRCIPGPGAEEIR